MQIYKKEHEKYLLHIWTRIKMLLNSILQSQKYICSLDGWQKKLSIVKIYNDKLSMKLIELQKECFAFNLDKRIAIKFDSNKAPLNPTILTTTNLYSKIDFSKEHSIDNIHSTMASNEHNFEIVFYLDCINLASEILYSCTQLYNIIETIPLLIPFVTNNYNINHKMFIKDLLYYVLLAKHLGNMGNLCIGCTNIINFENKLEVLKKLHTSFKKLKLIEPKIEINTDDFLEKIKNRVFKQIILFNDELCDMYANLCLAQYHLMTLNYLPFLLATSNFLKSYKNVNKLCHLSCNIDICPPWIQNTWSKFSYETTIYHALNEKDYQNSKLTNINTFIKKWWNKKEEMNDNHLLSLPTERSICLESQELQYNSKRSLKDKNNPDRPNLIEWAKTYQIHLALKAALYFTACLDCPTNMSNHQYSKIHIKSNLFEINDKLARFQRDMGAHVVCIVLDKSRFEANIKTPALKFVHDPNEKSKIGLKQIFEDVNSSLIDPYTYDSVITCGTDSGLQNNYAILAQSPEGHSEHLYRTYLPSFVMLIHRYYNPEFTADRNTNSDLEIDPKVICHLNVGDTSCHNNCRATELACLSKYGSCEPKKKTFNSNYLTQQATQNPTDAHNKFATIHSTSYEGDSGKSKGNNPDNGKRPSLFSLFSNHLAPSSSSNPKKGELAVSQDLLPKSEPHSPETNRLFWVGSFNEGSLGGLGPSKPLITFESGHVPRASSNGVKLCCQEPIRWDHSNLKNKFIHQSIAPFTTHYFYDKVLGQTYVICNLEYNHIFLLIVLPGEVSSESMNFPAPGKVFKESSLENNLGTGEDALNYTKHASLRNFLLYIRQKLDSNIEIEKLASIVTP